MRRLLLSFLVLWTTAGAQVTRPWKSDPHLIFLHRAARAVAPECTMEAVTKAYLLGADGVELDVRVTLDGIAVNYHDEFTIVKGRGLLPVAEMTYEELQELDGGDWFRSRFAGKKIVCIEDIVRFALANEFLLWIDVKEPAGRPIIEEMMERYQAWHLLGGTNEVAWRSHVKKPHSMLREEGIWRTGLEADPDALRQIIAIRREPFRSRADDPRLFCDILGRSAETRKLKPMAPKKPMAWPKLTEAMMVEAFLNGKGRWGKVGAVHLAKKHPERAVTEFSKILKDKTSRVSVAESAVRGAGHLADAHMAQRRELLAEALLSSHARVRYHAVHHAGRLRDIYFEDRLIDRVGDGDAGVRGAAAWSIGRLGRGGAQKLRSHLAKTVMSLSLETESFHTIVALGRVGDASDITAFKKLAMRRTPPAVGAALMIVLSERGEVEPFFGMEDRPLRVWGFVALANALARSGAKGRKALAGWLDHTNPVVRREAAFALGSEEADSILLARPMSWRKSSIGRALERFVRKRH